MLDVTKPMTQTPLKDRASDGSPHSRPGVSPPGSGAEREQAAGPRAGAVGAVELKPVPGRALFEATRPFAAEFRVRSWLEVLATLGVLLLGMVAGAVAPWWPVQLAGSVVGALMLVRAFILFHDFMHGSLLRKSRSAKALFTLVGLVMLSPPRYWRQTHNYHHGHVGKPNKPDGDDKPLLVISDIGSFPLMTTESWQRASAWQKLRYRVLRHPLTIMFAGVTVFMFGLTLRPTLQNPRKYWDGAVALLLHAVVIAGLWLFLGASAAFFGFVLPFALAAMLGAYLFYAQHNYEGMHVHEPEEWTYYRGAVESSSYMKLNGLMDWFTGNIGYHHIHHLNPLIPFYRLPEVMKALPELQHPSMTSLSPQEVTKCLSLNLWDPKENRLVGYGAAKRGRSGT